MHAVVALVDGAHFEDAHAVRLAVQVIAHVGDQAANQRGTHHAHLAGDRVLQFDRIGVAREIALPCRIDKAHVNHFLEAQVGQHMTYRKQGAGIFRRDLHHVRGHGRQGRDVFKAVHARHFLDQVFLDLDVETVAGRGHGKHAVGQGERQGQAREDVGDQRIGQRHADDFLCARRAHGHGLALRQVHHVVVDGADGGGRRAADFHDQGRDALDVLDGGGEIDAALEAVRRIGREIQTAGAALDRVRPPECRFQVDAVRIVRHRAGVAAHDAGQRFDFLLVGNDADPLVDGNGVAI